MRVEDHQSPSGENMNQITETPRRILRLLLRQADACANGIRFGFLFVRSRWFKIPRRVFVGGRSVVLHYPPDQGARSDFFTCFIRNEYGLRRQLADVRTILDIGANVGFFSMTARGRYPHSTIHAYEPNPRVLPSLESNTSALNIEIYNEAVGSREGSVEILESGSSNQAQTTTVGAGSIHQVTLQTAIERLGGSVDLLKLDCEGAEWDMFRLDECWKNIRDIRMEYHLFHGETYQQVEQTLQRLGFEVILWKPDAGFGTVWASRTTRSQ